MTWIADGVELEAQGIDSFRVRCATNPDDLNSSGIPPADAAIALQIAGIQSRPSNSCGDASGDGSVTSLDALMILQAACGKVDLS